MPGKKVCVIGAGLSGIASLKECVSQGLEPTCYEVDSGIGGLWSGIKKAEDQTTASLWTKLVTNTTKYNSCFSDFPPDSADPVYQPWKKYRDYLSRAATHYDVLKFIQFNTRVMKVRKTPDHATTGQWEVFTCGSTDKIAGSLHPGPRPDGEEVLAQCQKNVFDFVIVCCGYFRLPAYPSIEGLSSFKGAMIHSYYYKNPSDFLDKNVLVIGSRISSVDVASSLTPFTKQVYLAAGRGTWIMPRLYRDGRGYDFQITRHLLYSNNAEVNLNNMIIREAQSRLDHFSSGIAPDRPPSRAAISFSDQLQSKIASGEVKVYGPVSRTEENTAYFTDGSVITDLDAIILSTGFTPDLSFLDMDLIQADGKTDLYKFTFPLDQQHNTLALVGHCGVDSPAILPFECQARLCTMVFSGQLELPSQEQMAEDAEQWSIMTLMSKGNYQSYFLPGWILAERIAMECGFYPRFWKVFFRDPLLALRTWYGPCLVFQYRLVGPGSDWETARKNCHQQYEEGNSCLRYKKLPSRLQRPDIQKMRRHRVGLLIKMGIVVVFAVVLNKYRYRYLV